MAGGGAGRGGARPAPAPLPHPWPAVARAGGGSVVCGGELQGGGFEARAAAAPLAPSPPRPLAALRQLREAPRPEAQQREERHAQVLHTGVRPQLLLLHARRRRCREAEEYEEPGSTRAAREVDPGRARSSRRPPLHLRRGRRARGRSPLSPDPTPARNKPP